MYLSDQFLFLHLPKTGGWTVRRILAASGAPYHALTINQHAALHEIPLHLRAGRQIVATLREPCAWYRSYFHYNVRTDGTMSPFVARLMKGEPFDLKTALHAMLFPCPEEEPMQMLGIGHRVHPRDLAERDTGPYTWMAMHQLGEEPHARASKKDLWVIDTGRLREGLEQVFLAFGLEPRALHETPDDNRNVDLVQQGRRLLPYKGDLSSAFDEEMIQWVYEREAPLVRFMGYRGPETCATHAVVDGVITPGM